MNLILRFSALCFTALCFHQAWASIPYEDAQTAFHENDFKRSHLMIRKAFERKFLLHFKEELRVQIALTQLENYSDRELLSLRKEIRDLQLKNPLNSKLYFYEILTYERSIEDLSELDWTRIHQNLQEVHDFEGANLWVVFKTAAWVIRHRDKMEKEILKKWLLELRDTVTILPEIYLKPSITILLEEGLTVDQMTLVIPENLESYRTWLEILEAKEEWEIWIEIHRQYSLMKQKRNSEEMQEALDFLAENKVEEARILFEKISWRTNEIPQARAGYLFLETRNRQLNKSEEDELEKILLTVVREKGKLDSFLINETQGYLENFTQKDLIEAYLFYQNEEYEKAADLFLEIPELSSDDRYHYASSLFQIKRIDKLEKLFNLELQQTYADVNLRKLSFYSQIFPSKKRQIETNITENKPFYKPASVWSSDKIHNNTLIGKGRVGLVLTLPKGQSKIFFTTKLTGEPSTDTGALIVRLSGRYLATEIVKSKHWKSHTFEVDVAGGRYWIELESMNPKSKIQFGNFRIKNAYQKEIQRQV